MRNLITKGMAIILAGIIGLIGFVSGALTKDEAIDLAKNPTDAVPACTKLLEGEGFEVTGEPVLPPDAPTE